MKSSLKRSIRNWIGPKLVGLGQRILAPILSPRLAYSRNGWSTNLSMVDFQGWNSRAIVENNSKKMQRILELCAGTGPLGFSYEDNELEDIRNISFHNIHMTFAYVLARIAHKKDKISILDWGSGIGHYYILSKTILPEIEIEYYCVEVPMMVEAGKQINPEIHWYNDTSYFDRYYDLIMINASLQYVKEWKTFLASLAKITISHLFLTRIPVVEKADHFIAIQRETDTFMLHQQFNERELLETVRAAGFELLREFVVGDRPFIYGAPEQCEMRGWLFKRK